MIYLKKNLLEKGKKLIKIQQLNLKRKTTFKLMHINSNKIVIIIIIIIIIIKIALSRLLIPFLNRNRK